MAYKKNEITLAADVSSELFEAFDQQRSDRSQVKKCAVEAAIRLWISLPNEIQARLLSKSLSESHFTELIDSIVDQKMTAYQIVAAAEADAARQRQKSRRPPKEAG